MTSALAETLRSGEGPATSPLEEYLARLTNRISYMVLYRPARQHVRDAYVEPRIVDTVMSRLFVEPADLAAMQEAAQPRPALDGAARPEHFLPQPTFSLQFNYLSVSDLAAETRGAVILGEAGSGKSALLAWLCRARLSAPQPRLPVFLDAADLERRSIREQIDGVLNALAVAERGLVWLEERLALYVDGLDELRPQRFGETSGEIGEIAREMPSLPVTVACRGSAYRGELSFLREVGIAPFDQGRAESFVERWFAGATSGPPAADLIAQIRASEKLQEVASQPLLLSLLCNAFSRYLRVSKRQGALFDQCVDALLWEWDARRGIRRESAFGDLDLEKRKWLHSRLAATLHGQRKRYFGRDELLDHLAAILPSFGIPRQRAAPVLDEICAQHGIVAKWSEVTYGFGHLALQEFLAGKWLASERRWREMMRREVLADPWWRNTLAFCFASLSDATEAVRTVWEDRDTPELDKLHLLAACLQRDPILSPEMRERLLRRILYLFHNGDVHEHDAAVYMLMGISDETSDAQIRRSLAGKPIDRELARLLLINKSFRPD